MKKLGVIGVTLATGVFFNAYAQQETTIKIRVKDRPEEEEQTPAIPVEKKKATPKTETTVKEQELKRGAGLGGVNVFKAIELTPSLNVQTDDAYGLGGGSIRLRGFDGTQMGVTIDGMPLSDSGNYALYPHEYADVENLETITIERGAVDKKSPFYAEIGGAIRIKTKPPANRFGVVIFPKLGTNNFRRYFFRVDTGKLIGGLKAFASYSHTEADKWKGPGKYPEYRDHYALGIQQNYGRLFWEFYYDLNVQLNYFYRGLNYQQAQNLDQFRRLDYTPNLIFPGGNGLIHNNPAIRDNNRLYYKFYVNPYTNQQLRANVELELFSGVKLSFKPYMWIGRGFGSSATTFTQGGNNYIAYRESYNYTDRPGAILELEYKLLGGSLNLGYWYERSDLKQWQPSFPVRVNPDGSYQFITSTSGTPAFQYNYIQRTITTTNTPYFFYENSEIFNRLDVNFGIRLAKVERDFRTYSRGGIASNSSTVTGVPYYPRDGVYDDPSLGLNPTLSYKKTYTKFLPSIGLGYRLVDWASIYASYAKNFRVPQNFIGAVPASLTAEIVTDKLKPEEADNYDLGVRFEFDNFYLVPSTYYVNYKNRLVRVADPADPTLVYLRNAGKVKAYGFELELGYQPFKNLSLYGSLSYNIAEFKDNCTTLLTGNPVCGIRGKRIPDTPKSMLKLGLSARVFGFTIQPSVQHIGSRYGNITNSEKVSPYTLINLAVSRNITRNITVFADVINLTDKKYIGRISPGETSGTYYVGAPFNAAVGVRGRF